MKQLFMDVDEYIEAIRAEHFTAKDPVVYHFRISTQAGVNPQMTHRSRAPRPDRETVRLHT